MSAQDDFQCRFDEVDGEPVLRRIPVQPSATYRIQDHHVDKISGAERSLLVDFCREHNCWNEEQELLHRAEQRAIRHRQLTQEFDLAAREGNGYRPLTKVMLKEWLQEIRQPGLF